MKKAMVISLTLMMVVFAFFACSKSSDSEPDKSISGTVTLQFTADYGGVTVSSGEQSTTTNSSGEYTLWVEGSGDHEVMASKSGWKPETLDVDIPDNQEGVSDIDFTLTASVEAPTDAVYITYQDSVNISWTGPPGISIGSIVAYRIYRRENAGFSGLSESQLATYLAFEVESSVNSVTFTGLASDKKHYFAVRSMKADSVDTAMSALSNTVDTSPTIWFSDTVYEGELDSSALAGVGFQNQTIYPMIIDHLYDIDVYLGVDDSNYLALKSPSLYGTDWSSRVAEIQRLGVGTGVQSFAEADTGGWSDQKTLTQPNIVYTVRIGSHYSKIFIEAFIGGAPPNRGIAFSAAYQDVENYDHF